MEAVIVTEQLGKRYALGEGWGSGATLRAALDQALRRRRAPREVLWALRGIELEIGRGEAVGLIGRNGAGKSTLLRLLGRITRPTEGRCRTRGTIGTLLEVGTGFHPELTGRENVWLSGALVGMSRAETRARFDEVVAFAGVERFLDTPVKRYSSGMYLRLAFAVASHLRADVLLVDEILAVGDVEFQRRCLGRMSELVAEGRTILFASHDLDAVKTLCRRAVVLDGGRLVGDGASADAVASYLEAQLPHRATTTAGGAAGSVDSVSVRSATGGEGPFRTGEPLRIVVDLTAGSEADALTIGALVVNARGIRIVDETAPLAGAPGAGAIRAVLELPGVLNAGQYSLGIWIGASRGAETWLEDAVVFAVHGTDDGHRESVLHLVSSWRFQTRT